MIAMQYSFTLPEDYDMDIIRERVRLRAGSFDNIDSLLFKAFLITDKSDNRNKNEENRYSPFYLWKYTRGMTDFLMSDGFKNVPNSFGQPVINHWPCILSELRSKNIGEAKYATKEALKINSYFDFQKMQHNEKNLGDHLIRNGILAVVSAFEPRSWTLIRFCLWENLPAKSLSNSNARIYHALHVSAPV